MIWILKNSIRLNLIFLKNYWYFLEAIVIVLFLSAESIIGWLYTVTVAELRLYASVLIVLLNLRKVTGRYPIIRINPASIHFFRGVPLFKKLFQVKVFFSLIGSIAIGAVITTVIYRAAISKEMIIFGCATALCLFSSSLLAWIYYNSNSFLQKGYLIAIFFFVSGLLIYEALIVPDALIVLLILTLLTVFAVFRAYRTKILWDKYYRDCSFIYENMAAAAKKDMARMLEIVNKINALKKPLFQSIFIKTQPSPKIVLILKSFLGLVRTNIQTVKFQLAVFVAAIILKNLAFVMNPLLNKFLPAIILGVFYANYGELFRRQMLSVIDKKKKGFFLPFTDEEILRGYSVLPAIIFLISSSLIIVFTSINPYSVLLSWILYCAFYLITGLITIKFFYKQIMIWRVSGIVYFLIAIVCFALPV